MEPNTWRERDTFSKILSLPICTSCMPNVLSSRRVFNILGKQIFPRYEIQTFEMENCTRLADYMHDRKYILFFHHPINFCVHPCMGKRNMDIANEFQRVNSSVLSSKKNFQRKSSLWKMYLAETGKSWKNTLLIF